MSKYITKPIEIEAIQYLGDIKEIEDFINDKVLKYPDSEDGHFIGIPTFLGTIKVELGDYIVKSGFNDYYPYKPDIFKSLYTKV